MTTTTIRDFLVSLGYQVNKSSEQTFNDSLKKTAENAVKLGLAIEAAAAAVTGAVVKMAQGMEQSYYQSKRLGAAVSDIKAVGYAMSQVGGSAEGAQQAMEGIADFIRRLPGGKSYIQKLIGSEADASNIPAVMGVLAKKFASMPYANAKVQANFIGIDDNTLQAMIRDGGRYYDEYQKLVKKAGVNEDKLAGDSQALMVKVRSLGLSFHILGQKIHQALIAKAGPIIEKFKNWIDKNFDAITKSVSQVAEFILRLSDRIGAFVSRAMEWYDKLDPKSKNLANTVGGVAAAVWAFNKAFGASPVGIIVSLAAAIALLYDDYRRWKETGDVGLVDWSKWEPTIQSVTKALETISGWFKKLAGDEDGSIGGLQIAMGAFATYMATNWAASILATFGRIRLGMVGLAAYIAYETHKALNDNIDYDSLQKHIDAGDAKEWHDEQVSQNWFGKIVRRGSNWFNRQLGREEPYDENLRTKGVGGKSGQPTRSIGEKDAGLVLENQNGTRNLPITKELRGILQSAAEKNGVKVNVTSGGQPIKGTSTRRTGSTRHDVGGGRLGAADLNLIDIETGRKLDMQNPADEKRIASFMADSVAGGATGIGMGLGYMGSSTMHIGGGTRAHWGGAPFLPSALEEGEKRKFEAIKKKRKEQEDFITDRLSSIPDAGLPMLDGPFAPAGAPPTTPLLPHNVANTSSASMSMKTEIHIMGNADAKQVGGAVEKAGGNLLRNMQPAIR